MSWHQLHSYEGAAMQSFTTKLHNSEMKEQVHAAMHQMDIVLTELHKYHSPLLSSLTNDNTTTSRVGAIAHNVFIDESSKMRTVGPFSSQSSITILCLTDLEFDDAR